MAVRTGTQLRTDMGSVETAVNTCVTTPTAANGLALVSTCATLITNSKDSHRSVQETGTPGTGSQSAGQHPALDIGQIADQIRKDALHILGTGAATEVKSWKSLKRTNISHGPWPQFKTSRATTD